MADPSMPRTRAEAIRARRNQYFTGEPCKYGHVGPRWVASGACVLCNRNRAAGTQRYPGGKVITLNLLNPKDEAAVRGFVDLLNAQQNERIRKMIEDTRQHVDEKPDWRYDR